MLVFKMIECMHAPTLLKTINFNIIIDFDGFYYVFLEHRLMKKSFKKKMQKCLRRFSLFIINKIMDVISFQTDHS